MKEDSDVDAYAYEERIDELLNGFIDDELGARQRTEVERLIAHDVKIEQRLVQLQKCRTLVGSLPRAEAPPQILEGIKASPAWASPAPLQEELPAHDQRAGRIHLLGRRVLSAAAMIALVGILAGVIYTIMAPETASVPPVMVADRQPTANIGVPGSARGAVVASEFNGRLELRTSSLAQVDAIINTAIAENGLSDTIDDVRKPNERIIHYVRCSREALNSLLAGLAEVWPRLDSAAMFVDTEVFAGQVAVNDVTAEQIVEIIDQDNPEKRVALARDFGLLNNVAAQLPAGEILSAIEGEAPTLITTPKVMITGGDFETNPKPASKMEDDKTIRLTVVVSR